MTPCSRTCWSRLAEAIRPLVLEPDLPATLAIESLPLTLETLALTAATAGNELAARLRRTVAVHPGTP